MSRDIRPIDPEELIEIVKANAYLVRTFSGQVGPGMFIEGVRQSIDECVTLDVVPAIPTKWIKREVIAETKDGERLMLMQCGKCKQWGGMKIEDMIEPEYCGFCGARMNTDGERREEKQNERKMLFGYKHKAHRV